MPILKEPITTTAIYDGQNLILKEKPILPRGKFWIILLPQSNYKEIKNNKYQAIVVKKDHKKQKAQFFSRELALQQAYGLLKNKDNIDPLEYQHQIRDELEEHFNKLSKIK